MKILNDESAVSKFSQLLSYPFLHTLLNNKNVAKSAVLDENTRKEILSSAADSALDFILRILPSMSIPPFDGVKDGLIYHLSNLSMEGLLFY